MCGFRNNLSVLEFVVAASFSCCFPLFCSTLYLVLSFIIERSLYFYLHGVF
jgi:hypothetical protein